jgi:hypothetical protein
VSNGIGVAEGKGVADGSGVIVAVGTRGASTLDAVGNGVGANAGSSVPQAAIENGTTANANVST